MKKNKIIILIFILLIIIIIPVIVFLNFCNRDLVYKKSVSVKIGGSLPVIDDYVDKEEKERLDSDQIEWKDIPLEDGKLCSAGKYTGYVKFKDKKIEVTLEVIDDEAPTLEGVEDIIIYVI